jgi:hypothetical protein
MTARSHAVFAIVASLAILSNAFAAPPSVARAETEYLLGYIEASGCDFYRNGGRYDAAKAGAHLRRKYAAIGQAATAEAFIDEVASRSSLSGQPYEVSCAGQGRVMTAPWLREALARHRADGAPRDSRGAR